MQLIAGTPSTKFSNKRRHGDGAGMFQVIDGLTMDAIPEDEHTWISTLRSIFNIDYT